MQSLFHGVFNAAAARRLRTYNGYALNVVIGNNGGASGEALTYGYSCASYTHGKGTITLNAFDIEGGIGYPLWNSWAFLVAQTVKHLPAMWATQVQSLGREDPLEKGMTSH